MRLSAGLLWFLTLAALTVVAVVLLASTAPASCASAKDSYDHHLLAQAREAYASILADEPGSSCATDGMDAVVQAQCHRADLLATDKLTTEARKIYTSIVEAELPDWHGDARCARQGLVGLGG
jgi:hypothetical protein